MDGFQFEMGAANRRALKDRGCREAVEREIILAIRQSLTEKQREVVECYYNEDLSLAEIAEEKGITRQGVRDGIKRAEQQLLEMEERLGLAKRFRSVQEELTQICDHALQIEAENEKNGGDPVIRQNVESILRSAKKLTD